MLPFTLVSVSPTVITINTLQTCESANDLSFVSDVISEITKRGEVSYVEKAQARKLDIEIRDERFLSKLNITCD